jgi:mannose-1-phosphate guanylyltransferase
MAGGIGSRFWPVSRNSKPKQFLDILGMGKTFLQQTFDRFKMVVPVENILVVTSEVYKDLVFEQIPEILPANLLLEPYRRNTAPCIAYATYKLLSANPDATVVVAPSDHVIFKEGQFLEDITNALNYASEHPVLITLGIHPTRAETAYGYIQVNKASPVDLNGNVAYSVKTFTEKPNAELAKIFIESGEFLWNSGMFIWNLSTISREFEDKEPEITSLFREGKNLFYTENEQEFINKVYPDCKSISIDYAVMEKTDKAVVYPVSFGWSDLGTWESLYAHVTKDGNGNYVQSSVNMINGVSNSVVISGEKNKLIVINGLDNYMVINTDDVLMICPRNNTVFKNTITDLTLKDFSKYQ